MGDIFGIGHAVSHEGSHLAHEIESGVMDVKHAVEHGILQIRQETEKGIHEVKGAVPDEIENALKDALEDFAKALASPLLKQYAALLRSTTPDTVWLTIGPLTFTISVLAHKIEMLEAYASSPPVSKEELKKFITELEPDDVEVALKVNVPGVQSLSAGATLVYLKSSFVERIDHILDTIKYV